jgi:hypothetical protein
VESSFKHKNTELRKTYMTRNIQRHSKDHMQKAGRYEPSTENKCEDIEHINSYNNMGN